MFNKIAIILVLTALSFSGTGNTTSNIQIASKSSIQDVDPLWDTLGYFVLKPCESIQKFIFNFLDDAVEDAAKIAMICLAYSHSPVARASFRVKAAFFPVIYLVSNSVSDKLGDAVEAHQPCQEFKVPKRLLLDLANDIGEDSAKVGCYLAMLIKGFAPSMATARFLQQLNLAPEAMVQFVKGYAYFSAATKLTTDFQYCENNANLYGDWLESRLAELLAKLESRVPQSS